MNTNIRTESGQISAEELLHAALTGTLRRNGGSPESSVALMGKVAEEEIWRELPRYNETGARVGSFRDFTEYVTAFCDRGGLGMHVVDVGTLLNVKTETERRTHTDDPKLAAHRTAIRVALRIDTGEAPQWGKIGRGRSRPNRESATLSNRRDATSILARLKRDDEELAAAVIRGEISADAAARQKGWRYPRIELRNPETVAAKVREHFTADQIRRLIDALTDVDFDETGEKGSTK